MAGGTSFRVWAPKRTAVAVVVEGGAAFPLAAEAAGYFSGAVADIGAGTRYRFRLDREEMPFPDPASRFQPEGPHGPSEVIDPVAYRWRDQEWPGCRLEGQVIYEMHVGTFTPEGTWRAAIGKLPHLREIGISLIEMMPVAEFPGHFGWGYDGVDLFAPTRLYGRPDDLRRFVDEAHRLGIGVILDVVYNHFGPDGNYTGQFSDTYFKDYANEWGDALNLDGPGSAGVRDFFTANAAYWIDEYHFDGLRLDATQSIHDRSPDHVIAALVRAARRAACQRDIVIVAENEPQQTSVMRSPDRGGYGVDAMWNDDFHHSAMVALTGRKEAYYSDHSGSPQEFVSAAKYGFLFQGQTCFWQAKRRGTPAVDLPPAQFVTFIQNHDQVANTARGMRVGSQTTPGRLRAMAAMMLLMPGTPMLFQGQEFNASTPFLYFADSNPELRGPVREGRRDFLAQFPNLADAAMAARLADPGDRETFVASKLDWGECDRNQPWVRLHRDLIRLRRSDAAFRRQARGMVDGAVLGPEALLIRYFAESDDDRLLLANFGLGLTLRNLAEPLAAPPPGRRWTLIWSSEHPDYGGDGTPPIETRQGWYLPGHVALVFGTVAAAGAEDLPDLPGNPALRGDDARAS